MRRKFLPLFLTCALLLNSSMAFAADVNEPAEGDALTVVSEEQEEVASEEQEVVTEEAKEEESVPVVLEGTSAKELKYIYVEADAAVAALKKGEVYVIDVRSTESQKSIPELKNYANVISQPLFAADFSLPDDLAATFKEQIDAKITDKTKPIYILCNSGKRGAEKATQLLTELGYSTGETGNVYTITGGAKALSSLQLRYELLGTDGNPVTSEEAVKAVGSDKIAILDIRADEAYKPGHLKGAISAPVFANGPALAGTDSDETAQAFLSTVTGSAKDKLAGKDIYVVCYTGNKGAKAATVLLTQAGYDLSKIHTVTGGAAGDAVKAASTYVSDTRVIEAINNGEKDVLVIDVRNTDLYAKGHLKGSLSLPLFDKDNKLPDDLAKAFSDYVAAHKADFDGKTIYVLCNSGARGAQKAIELLTAAGLKDATLRTIENGAKSELIQTNFVTDEKAATTEPAKAPAKTPANNKAPKTGDAAPIMPLALSMFAALCAIVAISKKKIVK